MVSLTKKEWNLVPSMWSSIQLGTLVWLSVPHIQSIHGIPLEPLTSAWTTPPKGQDGHHIRNSWPFCRKRLNSAKAGHINILYFKQFRPKLGSNAIGWHVCILRGKRSWGFRGGSGLDCGVKASKNFKRSAGGNFPPLTLLRVEPFLRCNWKSLLSCSKRAAWCRLSYHRE